MKSILICGVGGQGTLLASRVLGDVFLNEGFDVKVSEIHGMSQRGGSVTTYVKYGEKVYSPLIDKGEADYILAFEISEAARALPYLKKGGKIISADSEIPSMPVITGAVEYPADLPKQIRDLGVELTVIPALELAKKAGNPKALNTVLIGALSTLFENGAKWLDAVVKIVPPKVKDVNIKAFEFGAEYK
ncbi:MAG: indolepyruvate oxidoreductase subunit beta [Oscillospiraceae bacterium]|jgi:indolepyruvate ferredoxin oxidoreductase beta subunit|nr:indolepyruvate oxidoreductase subunit beta [Oscillospiraceae bacterium]